MVIAAAEVRVHEETSRAQHPHRSREEIAADVLHTEDWLYVRARDAYDADPTGENLAELRMASNRLQVALFRIQTKTDFLSLTPLQIEAFIDIWTRQLETELESRQLGSGGPRALPATVEGEVVEP